jgi:hypothetical protein
MRRTNQLTMALTALALAACGGGGIPISSPVAETATIGGTISGLSAGAAVLLVNNGTETISVGQNGAFTFGAKVAANAAYSVALVDQPTGSYCTLSNGAGIVAARAGNVANIAAACQPAAVALESYHVGVSVSGLAAGGTLSLQNNGSDPLVVHANGLALFPKVYAVAVAAGGNYAVTVSTNPAGQTCTVSNGSGNIATSPYANFVNIAVACV